MNNRLFNLALREFGLTKAELARIIETAPRRYKKYKILKRNGGTRTIAQPAKELKSLQYIVMNEVLGKLPVHEAAKAYKSGTSILQNALIHAENPNILKMDFTDFFGSIKAPDFIKLCNDHLPNMDRSDLLFCVQVLFWKETANAPMKLSIGAPSSPALSNAMMYEFDKIISDICNASGVAYSRYADDLTFSSEHLDHLLKIKDTIPNVLKSLKYPTIYVNWEKTVLSTKKRRRSVTGLIITNDSKVSIGRDKKRAIRAAVHSYVVGKLDADQSEQLRGHLAYIKSVEPDFYNRLINKYGAESIDGLMKKIFRRKQKPGG